EVPDAHDGRFCPEGVIPRPPHVRPRWADSCRPFRHPTKATAALPPGMPQRRDRTRRRGTRGSAQAECGGFLEHRPREGWATVGVPKVRAPYCLREAAMREE